MSTSNSPTPEQREDPRFKAIWEVIRDWEITSTHYGRRRVNTVATGGHAVDILKALDAARSPTEEGGESDPICYAVVCSLAKAERDGSTTVTTTLSTLYDAASEDEARGSAVNRVMTAHPGFSLKGTLVRAIYPHGQRTPEPQ